MTQVQDCFLALLICSPPYYHCAMAAQYEASTPQFGSVCFLFDNVKLVWFIMDILILSHISTISICRMNLVHSKLDVLVLLPF